MTIRMWIFGLLSLLTSAVCLWAQDGVSGEWLFKMQAPQGEVDGQMVLKADGAKLSGSITMGERKFEITDGSVNGKAVKWTIKRARPDGGTMVYQMSGTIEGAEIKGTTKTDVGGQEATSDWSAKKK